MAEAERLRPLTQPAAGAAYKRFAEGKTLAQGRIHFARANQIKGVPMGKAHGESRAMLRTRTITAVMNWRYLNGRS